jgi:DNA invertase Pin-like site-specific DNA recombinase
LQHNGINSCSNPGIRIFFLTYPPLKQKKSYASYTYLIDKQSGKDFDRVQYQLLKRIMRKGDVLYIHSLDRFGRNKEEILQEWNDITKNIQVDIVVLDMPLLDTTQFKDSLGNFIADLVLQILSLECQH